LEFISIIFVANWFTFVNCSNEKQKFGPMSYFSACYKSLSLTINISYYYEGLLSPVHVSDAPSDDREENEHSNVIPLLPVQSRDRVKTGRISRRRRREAVERSRSRRLSGDMTSGGENAVMRDGDNVNEQHSDAAAAIVVSQYVTG